MDTIRTETIIQAPTKAVWQALINFAEWSQWNPVISQLIGEPKMGKKVALYLGKKRMSHPKIIELIEDKHLKWKGRGGPMGLLRIEHTFLLEPLDASSTRFTQIETFSGWLTPVIFDQIEDRVKNRFEAMDGAFKKRCEGL